MSKLITIASLAAAAAAPPPEEPQLDAETRARFELEAKRRAGRLTAADIAEAHLAGHVSLTEAARLHEHLRTQHRGFATTSSTTKPPKLRQYRRDRRRRGAR